MRLAHLAGKHAYSILALLLCWAFIFAIPLRWLTLERDLPALFSSPLEDRQAAILLLIGLLPFALLSLPLYLLHRKYEIWHETEEKRIVELEVDRIKNT
jgi:hypothetical protein